jgi:DNA polymerase
VANGAGNASGGAPAQALQTARPAPSAAGDEDTSWFDDAPAAPAARPALKSAAPARAPTPPKAAAPEAGAESYAWFDDVPATPVSKPARAPAPERESEPDIGASPAAPAAPRTASRPAERQAPPADEMPWFDDAPLPSFDALPDDIAFDDQYGEEEAGVSAAAIARMDWPALRAAVQACTRCGLCRERSAAVPGRGPAQAPWLVLGTAPAADDEAQARPLAGAPGQLLDNMLKAIAIAPEQDAYVTTLVKCRPPGDRAPTADETAACRPYLEREIVLAGTRAVVALGHTAAKGLLGAAARGKVLRLQHIPVVATYHPADLLRKPEDKARAWADLCLARSAFDGRGA